MMENVKLEKAVMKPKQVVLAWVNAFNKGDVEGISEFYAEDAINHQVMKEPVVGKQAIHAMFQKEFHEADMHCTVENIFEDGDWAILEWKDPLGFRGCGFFQIVEGKIVFQRGYWDRISFFKAHNLPVPDRANW